MIPLSGYTIFGKTALSIASLLYLPETTCRLKSCAIMIRNAARKIRRMIRLLDWLNTDMDQSSFCDPDTDRERMKISKYKVRTTFCAFQMLVAIYFCFKKIFCKTTAADEVSWYRASLNYAVLVRNFILRGNNNSIVKISNMLMAVVATILIKKLRNVPNDNHSSKVK